jgi:hypothetical protein
MHQHLCSSLGSSIWVGWSKNACLEEIILIILNLSVNLIGRDVDELLDSNLLRTLQQNVCTVDIGMCESVGVTETQVDVRLSCEMEDCVNVMSLQTVHDL